MIGIAWFLVFDQGFDNLPYDHQHVWMSEGWLYAPVELVEWQQETEKSLHVTLCCFEWWLEERPDSGY